MPDKSALLAALSEMLMDCDLFKTFPPAEIQSVARYFGVSNMEKDGVIFNEGDAGKFMCIVNTGNISVVKSNQDGVDVRLATLYKGRSFGEMAVLDGERRSAKCVAETDCILLTLSKDSLDKMLDETPRTAAKVIRAVAVSLSRRLRMADGKLVDHQV